MRLLQRWQSHYLLEPWNAKQINENFPSEEVMDVKDDLPVPWTGVGNGVERIVAFRS